MFEHTFSSVVSTVAAFAPIPMEIRNAQSMRVFCTMASATTADTATLNIDLIVDGDRVASFPATVTAIATANADGDKMGVVAFDEGGTSAFDALGASYTSSDRLRTKSLRAKEAYWAIGATVFGGATTAVTVYVATSEEI